MLNLHIPQRAVWLSAGVGVGAILSSVAFTVWLLDGRSPPPKHNTTTMPLAMPDPMMSAPPPEDDIDMSTGPLAAAPVPEPVAAPAPEVAPPPPPPPRYIENASPLVEVKPGEPMIAIVLDDMGVNVANSADALSLPKEITFSFLPYGHGTLEQAKEARQAGHEIMIHIPMEPMPRMEEPPVDPGPNALYVDLPADEIERRTHVNIDPLKDMAVGANNHMGSRFTSEVPGMREVLNILQDERLFFLDSLTIGNTKVPEAAQGMHIPVLTRNVFIDHYLAADSIRKALEGLEHVAREKGYAIAIGHPHQRTLQALRDWLPTLAAKGIAIVPITQLLPKPSQTASAQPHGD